MTECIVIPQWILGIVGLLMVVIASLYLKKEYEKMPHESVSVVLGSVVCLCLGATLSLIGILPYLPCVVLQR